MKKFFRPTSTLFTRYFEDYANLMEVEIPRKINNEIVKFGLAKTENDEN